MVKYLLIGLAVVSVSVFGLYYFHPPGPSATVVGADGRVVQVQELAKLAASTCLTGERLTGKAGIEGALDQLSGKGSATTQVEQLRGAVDVLDEKLKLQENAGIRECMQRYTDRIFNLITGKVADASSSLPRQLDLRFSMAFADANNSLYEPSALYVGEKLRSAQSKYVTPDPRLSVSPDSVYVWPNVLLPSRERPYSAILHRVVHDGFREDPKGTEVCLIDGAAPPASSELFAVLRCEESSGQCTLKKPDDPGWVNFCPKGGAALTLPAFISTAHAEEPSAKIWSVPSLETLGKRNDLRGVGYTKFKIAGSSLPGQKIDGFVLDLKVNGAAVRIDGVDPEYHALAYDPAKGLDVEFALQNLDFAGVNSGCDTIEASFRPVSDGRIAGPSVVLKRSYVALRDAEPVTMEAVERKFTWTGNYVRPLNGFDHEVLVNSIELSDLGSKPQLDNARQRVNGAKRQVDGMGLTFRGMRVVGVVRPPLTKASFGTALGVVAPTGQIQFTFDRATAIEFKASVVEQAKRIPRGSQLIRDDTFVYPLNKDVDAPKGICTAPS